jgi:O-antigen/teichoic acid export membrane protein
VEFASSRVGVAILSTLGVAIAARAVPVGTFGVYAAASGFALLLFMFLDFGNNNVLVREAAAEGRRTAAIRVFLQVRILLTAATLLVGVAGAFLLFEPAARPTVFLSLGMVLLSAQGMLLPLGQVQATMRPYRRAVLGQAAVALAGVLFVLYVLDVKSSEALALAAVAGAAFATVYSLRWVRRWAGSRLRPFVWEDVRRQLGFVAVLGSAVVLASVYHRINGALVLRLDGAEASGNFGIAYRILDQARTVPTALLVPLGPLIAYQFRQGGLLEGTDRTLRRLADKGGLGLAIGVMSVADLIVLIVAGPAYYDAAVLAVLLAVTLAMAGLIYTVLTTVIMSGGERSYVLVAAVALAFNVAANLALIPEFGARAAATVTVATELFVGLALLAVAPGHDKSRYVMSFAVTLAGGAAAAAAKIAAMSAGIAVNVSVSAALVGVAAALLHRAYQDLKAMPSPPRDEEPAPVQAVPA